MDGFKIPLGDKDALAGFADALEAQFFHIRTEEDFNLIEIAVLHNLEILDEFAFLDHFKNRDFHAGMGHYRLALSGFDGIANAGEQIGNRISVHIVSIKELKGVDRTLKFLPAGLLDSHHFAFIRVLPKTDAADLKESEVATGTSAKFASVVNADPLVHFLSFGFEFRLKPLSVDAKCFSGHKTLIRVIRVIEWVATGILTFESEI